MSGGLRRHSAERTGKGAGRSPWRIVTFGSVRIFGEDVAPALEWSGAPDGTKAFAVVVHDPDAPLVDGFTHWVAYNIPGDATGLPEGGGDATAGTKLYIDGVLVASFAQDAMLKPMGGQGVS